MKKVSSPKQIKIKTKNKRNMKKTINQIIRAENKMINSDSLIGKTGGNSFDNYNLDLMKLK